MYQWPPTTAYIVPELLYVGIDIPTLMIYDY